MNKMVAYLKLSKQSRRTALTTYGLFGCLLGQPDFFSFFDDGSSPGVRGQHFGEPLELGLWLLSEHILSHVCTNFFLQVSVCFVLNTITLL